jgi:mRNA-degrading endonuclease toxin of MazEF toxin-antitoxin module
VTTRIRGIPVEVPLGLDDGLPQESVANLDDITTLPKSRLENRISILSNEKFQAVEWALRFALGLET